MSTESFLSRWSRRKQQVREAEQSKTPAIQTEASAPDLQPDSVVPQELRDEALPEAELGPEEIAKLPSLDELTAETDISVFLRKGVPERLRNAALRRMWSLDPAIRDFLSEAREYAYDWNTPGGVPGSGPLPPSEDIARLAAQIVGGGDTSKLSTGIAQDTSPAATPASQNREQLSSARPADEADALVAPQDQPTPVAAGGCMSAANQEKSPPQSPTCGSETQPTSATASQQTGAEQAENPARVRRHGGAMPL